jgi:uncharacterized protein
MNRLPLWALTVSCMLILVFSGCRSITPPVSYYILNPTTAGLTLPADADGNPTQTVGINPIELPGYLNRVQMVIRTGPNQLDVSSSHRWADYPDRMVQQVLGENLNILMAGTQVYTSPWPAGFKPDVTVDVTFLDLIGTTDKKMLLSAVWTINGGDSPSSSHRTTFSETVSSMDFDDLAAAHSQALETLSRDISETLRAFLK